MLPINIQQYIRIKITQMLSLFFKYRILIAIIFSIALVSLSCKKSESTVSNQVFFETNVLNQTLTVHLALDNGSNLTSQFAAYTFSFATNGTMTASNSLLTFSGTWSTTSDYSTLTIILHPAVPEFAFLNRQWKFTRFSVPIMEFAPSASGDNKGLHFQKM
jgi:hypothetical protein